MKRSLAGETQSEIAERYGVRQSRISQIIKEEEAKEKNVKLTFDSRDGRVNIFEEGFVGVGVGRHEDSEVLRVYVSDADLPFVRCLQNEPTYEGFPVIVEVTGNIRAFSVSA